LIAISQNVSGAKHSLLALPAGGNGQVHIHLLKAPFGDAIFNEKDIFADYIKHVH
jgi:hypothetical protein